MHPQFLSREIQVKLGENIPVSFKLDSQEYKIATIVYTWPDYGFGRAPLQRRRWWHRRHRNYYIVKTEDGKLFEIYHDRGTSLEGVRKGKWYVYRQL